METLASQRLIDRVTQVAPNSIGIAEGIARILLTEEVIDEIKECLSSSDVGELKWGLSFALGFLESSPQEFLKWLIVRAPDWLKHEDWDVRSRALNLFVRFRTNYDNYRELMVRMLNDPNQIVRWNVLREYLTFLNEEDIPLLLKFQHDDYMSETQMGSPLVYMIRNDALSAIEDLCGKQFRKSEKVEPGEDGLLVYWWDWAPFLEWWEGQNRGWKFWKK